MITHDEILANRKTWTDALRSGRYLQGRHRMRLGNEYCCLGVFCETGVVPGQWTRDRGASDVWHCTSGASSKSLLSTRQRAAVGLSTDEQETLMRMNDARYYPTGRHETCTFDHIADYIDSLPIPEDTP